MEDSKDRPVHLFDAAELKKFAVILLPGGVFEVACAEKRVV
jgi:hypothetical protein